MSPPRPRQNRRRHHPQARYTRVGFPLEFGGWSRRRSSPSRKVRAPWAGCWLTASRDDSKESATESKPPGRAGNRAVRQG